MSPAHPMRVLAVGDPYLPAGIFASALAGQLPGHPRNPEIAHPKEAAS